jgi:DNA repair exonuclease SbcCD nuclease subunit
MNNKVAIFSDLHIGVHQNSNFWIETSLEWAKWFASDLKSKGIKDIIFCGDFFHYRDEISLISLDAANSILDILNDFNIIMIPGNHDCYYKETSEINSLSIFKGRPNIKIYDKLYKDYFDNGISIVFCPWGTKLDDIPSADIVFGHFELLNFKMNMHKICDDGDDVTKLVEKTSLVFSGHFHLRDEKCINDTRIIYTGNTYQMNFDDAYQTKGYYILDKSNLEYEFIPFSDGIQHIKIFLSKLIKLTDLDKELCNIIPNNIIRIVIDKNITSDHLDLIIAKLTTFKPNEITLDYDISYNKLKVKDMSDVDLSGVDIAQAIEEFVNLLDINNKREVIDYTLSLFNRSKL